ncbi:MAG: glutamate-semialdehyde -aminomutase, partial [Acidobacteriaceae bacterium]|nr:glutamate-semialdehyde -aminomutase [Acidobacteriaceae bacterium]
VGAYGAAAKIMDMVAPLGPVYQAGTLSGNPLAMAAGLATLKYLRDHNDVYQKLEFNAELLVEGVAQAAQDAGVKLTCNRVGSMFTFFFRKKDENVWDWASAEKSDTVAFGKFHRAMLDAGVYLPPSQFEAAFLSIAHTPDDIQETIDAARIAFKSIRN